MSDQFNDAELAAEEKQVPNDQLKRITAMAEQLLAAQDEVKRLTDALANAKADQNRLEQEDLPELMREVGLKSFKLEDGREIELVDEVSCAITEANHSAAMKWLEDHKFGGLIKTNILFSFGRDQRDQAIKLAKEFQDEARKLELAIDSVVKEGVYAATLKSFVKEQMAKGENLPADIFSIHPYSKVKVSKAKSK